MKENKKRHELKIRLSNRHDNRQQRRNREEDESIRQWNYISGYLITGFRRSLERPFCNIHGIRIDALTYKILKPLRKEDHRKVERKEIREEGNV